MLAIDSPRPAKLYLYAGRVALERCLTLGEFQLRPELPVAADVAAADSQILPFRHKQSASGALANFLTLRLTHAWDDHRFDAATGADCCLVIHQAEIFGERIHRAAQKALPNWAGIDAAVSYGLPSPLGAAFSKTRQQAAEREWLFAWRPVHHLQRVHPVVICIGNIESIAELRGRSN